MKNNNLLIASLAGVAVASSTLYGWNDRLGTRVDIHNSNETAQLSEDIKYDNMQPELAMKPVRMDISSKVEVDIDNKTAADEKEIVKQRYVVAPENKAKSFPDAAKTGECYGELVYPAEMREVEERVMTSAGYTEMEIIPAEYEWVEQQVIVKDAETRLEIVPATYKTIEERVLVEPQRTVTEYIPATFTTEERQVLVRPAYKEWKDGTADVENRIDTQLTGDVVCLVETPAQYETVSVKVLDAPARTETKTIPAKYETVQRTVIDQPAYTREVTVPAEYATVEVRKLVEAERVERKTIEPVYTTMTRFVEAEPAYTKWERVLCKESIAPVLAFEIEKRLKDEGFNPGPIDGKIDATAESAIEEYQMDQGMAKGGITPSTLESLGIVDFDESVDYQVSSI